MPARKRPRIEPTDDWSELQLRFDWLEQTHSELIRPVVRGLDLETPAAGPGRPR